MTSSASTKKTPELTSFTLWIMTITTGLVVANIYYNQPLLGDIAHSFKISNGIAGRVSMITQMGYAAGMFFIAPLADMFERKKLMLFAFAAVIVALIGAAMAPDINLLILASFLVGMASLIPQLLIPMAAHLAKPEERGKKIGVVMSGLLIGILLSRTISGFIGAHFGWRAMFFIAAGLMVLMVIMVFFFLPEVEPDYKGSYKNLMKSLIHLFKAEPKLRFAALRGALCFACFSAFWTTIVFLLKENFNMGSDAAGLFGLVGAFGAVAAGLMGRLSDKTDPFKLSFFTLLLVLLSFVVFIFSGHSIIGLVIGVIILDMGVQATHISNQAIIFSLNAEARNRINTIYMVSYFLGGAAGTFLVSSLWGNFHWMGVCVAGIALSTIAIIVHLLNHKSMQNKPTSV
ncbi:MFS transporter [Mucilaginibacter sp. X5P1]|uniref:MFS transporter n=1 Tax=Mucilaginibacter sp. X5P1 TaxID=2723088 RepID=UPI0017D8637C|nr:MFS transporter [Mucilaginibacter sp. X5P1]MBB6141066.1 putative MFS family arabinose efflux permease [Mucilaginibacter sp. X5P1]